MTNRYDPTAWFQQSIQQLRQEFENKLNHMAGGVRRMVDEKSAHVSKQLEDLASIAKALRGLRSGGGEGGFTWYSPSGIARIEDIPGRRVPFDLTVDIFIGNNTTSLREGSVTISQEGPFVAVKRYVTFQSALEFQVTERDGSTPRFSGRSFGRYRPTSSAWDIFDAHSDAYINTFNPMTNGTLPGVGGITSSISGLRTMEFDGRIQVLNAGSSFPRQNDTVPSSMWTPQINAPFDLGALDFFERGEVITFRVQPTHVNNPPAGNADGLHIFGTAGWPFLAGQYDQQEGIVTPAAFSVSNDVVTRLETDVVSRLPDGVLTIGFHGYRIQQPVGPVG